MMMKPDVCLDSSTFYQLPDANCLPIVHLRTSTPKSKVRITISKQMLAWISLVEREVPSAERFEVCVDDAVALSRFFIDVLSMTIYRYSLPYLSRIKSLLT